MLQTFDRARPPSQKGESYCGQVVVGTALLRTVIDSSEAAGIWSLQTGIFPENTASRALCRRHGFREVGVYERHARLDGVWRDVVIVERLLGDAVRS